jgi:hemerythrin
MTIASPMLVPKTGVLAIDIDHEQLQAMLEAAHRATRLGDAESSLAQIGRAVRLAELHAQEQEEYLIRSNFDRVLDIRREHERLVLALEQLLHAAQRRDADIVTRVQAVRIFLRQAVQREADGLRRFLRRVA